LNYDEDDKENSLLLFMLTSNLFDDS